ncbi:MAG: hypothetical protein ACTS8S_07620 [Giesbergeria sp.]
MMVIGPEHALAQLTTSLAFADSGPLNSKIYLYADGALAAGGTPVDPPLAAIELAKPCGTLAAGVLTLHVAVPGGNMVDVTGIPYAAQWLNGDGALVSAGTVSATGGDGDFTVAGGTTAPGETSPTLYAGGLVLLGAVVLD